MEGGNRSVPSGGCTVSNWDKMLKRVMNLLTMLGLSQLSVLSVHKCCNDIARHPCYEGKYMSVLTIRNCITCATTEIRILDFTYSPHFYVGVLPENSRKLVKSIFITVSQFSNFPNAIETGRQHFFCSFPEHFLL